MIYSYDQLKNILKPGMKVRAVKGKNNECGELRDDGGKANLHPTTKPRKLIGNLINLFSNQDDLVLDPFLGSGTTAVCCQQGNRKFIGIELDPKYVKVAEDRLKQQVLNF